MLFHMLDLDSFQVPKDKLHLVLCSKLLLLHAEVQCWLLEVDKDALFHKLDFYLFEVPKSTLHYVECLDPLTFL